MAITHHWSIHSTIKYLDAGGTVCKVIFKLQSQDSDNPELLNITTISSVNLDTSHIENFVPFDQLTEQEVLQWVFDRLTKYQICSIDSDETKYDYEIYHEKYLENLKNPTLITPNIPNTVNGYIMNLEPVQENTDEVDEISNLPQGPYLTPD